VSEKQGRDPQPGSAAGSADILNLKFLRAVHVKETGSDCYITAEAVARPSRCPRCGAVRPRLTGHGRKRQIFQDIPLQGRRVGILIDRRRYICRECGCAFLERLDDMDDRRNVTRRLLRYIQARALTETFTSLAREIGLDEKTVRLVFNDHVTEQLRSYQPEAPRWLGIEDAYLLHDSRCLLTDIEGRSMLDILQNRSRSTVWAYLSQLNGRERVEFVCMSMWPPYRDAVNYSLPNARIIIDRRQVVNCVNSTIETAARTISSDLTPGERRLLGQGDIALTRPCSGLTPEESRGREHLMCRLPLLKLACQLDEELRNIFTASHDRAEAERSYDRWTLRIVPGLKRYFNPLVRLMNEWRTEIFNYFDVIPGYPLNDAYTEPLAGLIGHLGHTGRNRSFQALRARILLTAPTGGSDRSGSPGVHIPTLLQVLESKYGQ
jgi:transposase